MELSFIVAVAENNVIGQDNQLPWHLPADLKYFKKITTGHTIIMGRKTYESIGKPLPNRRSVIVTRQTGYEASGCTVVASIAEALDLCSDEQEVFLIGGAELYSHAMDRADKLYITHIHHTIQGDRYFPEITKNTWKEIEREDCSADEKNPYDYSFVVYKRR
ncbi:MAG: dihydrofolate reductase [Flavobacteriales bacterium]|nr:dihydrofolate reductase [Flavobacteriales bacterium]